MPSSQRRSATAPVTGHPAPAGRSGTIPAARVRRRCSGWPAPVWVLLALFVAAASSLRAQAPSALPLDLPASFTGTLPCADCPGIDWHLDLWADGRFHLQRRYRDREGDADALGRWRLAPDGQSLLLFGAREAPLRLAVLGRRRLRLLDTRGRPIQSTLPYDLLGSGRLQPAELSLALAGRFRYLADAALFEECLTGHGYPVLMAGAYRELERAYLAADKAAAGAPLPVRLEARVVNRRVMEGEGPPASLQVQRLLALQPEMRCDRAMSTATLPNTYWRLLQLGAEVVPVLPGAREPHLLFRDSDGSVGGLAGCNRLRGAYRVDGGRLALDPLATTRMLCPPPVDAFERRLLAALRATAGWRIRAQRLELLDADGDSLAAFEAVYQP